MNRRQARINENYAEIMDFLDELQQKGHTIVMITHDMQLMPDHSDQSSRGYGWAGFG